MQGLVKSFRLFPFILIFIFSSPVSAQLTAADYSGCGATTPARTLQANPNNYLNVVDSLRPGDRLQLAAGNYTDNLPLYDLHGEPGSCIVIQGPAGGGARFAANGRANTIDLVDVSYLIIRHLELDGRGLSGVDAIKAKTESQSVHHLTLEALYIHDYDGDQSTVGINSKCPAWNWVIRRNRIENIGTGVYLGNSEGDLEFVHGLIEYNLMLDTIGYNMQVKHQDGRSNVPGMPTGTGRTIIRHNVFSKTVDRNGDGARPNLLVGHFPPSGPGANDFYLIYGNFFYQNPTESLFQGEGNIAFYNNLLYNSFGDAVRIQPHNGVPKSIRVFYNTVIAADAGIHISGGDSAFTQSAIGNAVFAGNNPRINAPIKQSNVQAAFAAAASYLGNPGGTIDSTLNLYPRPGQLAGAINGIAAIDDFPDWNRDFNLIDRGPGNPGFRGAYAGNGQNPGWRLARDFKPLLPAGPLDGIFSDEFDGS